MEKYCKDIEEMLVDYADDQLPPVDSSRVAEHLATCEHCRTLLSGLQKSLELAGVIWADSLAEIEHIRISAAKTRKIRRLRYAAIAASILIAATASVVWLVLTIPTERTLTFAEIERRITESGSAAQLLAAAELLSDNPDAENIVKQQYQYIIETYPQTSSAIKAKSKMR